MKDVTREVMELLFEFLLSMFIIAGSGFLIYKGIASELASGVITLVTGFWFTKRANESAVNNLLRQSPSLAPIVLDNVTPITQTLETITNSSNSPTTTPPPKTGNNI